VSARLDFIGGSSGPQYSRLVDQEPSGCLNPIRDTI
jgi:hypothetical protein